MKYTLIALGVFLQVVAIAIRTNTLYDYTNLSLSILLILLGLRFTLLSEVSVALWFIVTTALPLEVEQGSGFYLSLVAIGLLTARHPPHLGITLCAFSAFAVYYGYPSETAFSGKFGMLVYLIPLILGFGYHHLRAQQVAAKAEERIYIATLREELAGKLHDNLSGNLVQIALLSRMLPEVSSKELKEDSPSTVAEEIRLLSKDALTQLRDFTNWLSEDRKDTTVPVLSHTPTNDEEGYTRGTLSHSLLRHENRLRSVGFIPDISISGDTKIPEIIEKTAVDLLEEIVTNIMKHGKPLTKAYILVRLTSSAFHLYCANTVTEDESLFPFSGHGTRNMKSKIDSLHGSYKTNNEDGQYTISITIPIDN